MVPFKSRSDGLSVLRWRTGFHSACMFLSVVRKRDPHHLIELRRVIAAQPRIPGKWLIRSLAQICEFLFASHR
jgi:hypothetical protein